ncbi:hypothetical protein X474_26850 [Dethiosulfatarculus sandiegensis]|uniref:Uncharacterized protein n=1 Tax=Dethiosulfatarculus sandiegensis TaxID=1429043 RepID=A0A0D2JNC4_9BACT|nr:hypothetical protein X474_26850 [Dethiosulfatarculus sandiegensis]
MPDSRPPARPRNSFFSGLFYKIPKNPQPLPEVYPKSKAAILSPRPGSKKAFEVNSLLPRVFFVEDNSVSQIYPAELLEKKA